MHYNGAAAANDLAQVRDIARHVSHLGFRVRVIIVVRGGGDVYLEGCDCHRAPCLSEFRLLFSVADQFFFRPRSQVTRAIGYFSEL